MTRPRPNGAHFIDQRELRLLVDRRRFKAFRYTDEARRSRVEVRV
jgi:hypothetical protein